MENQDSPNSPFSLIPKGTSNFSIDYVFRSFFLAAGNSTLFKIKR